MLEMIRSGSKRTVFKARALVSFGRLVRDPNRLNEVFEMADALTEHDPSQLEAMVRTLSESPEGAAAFRAKPRLGKLDLAALAALPEGTLGRAFADHMHANGLVPEAIPTLGAADDLEFLRAHLYETHDLWHVVAGFGTDVAGELGLQAFYVAQTSGPLPRAILALGLLNGVIYAQDDFDRRVAEVARGFTLGRAAKPLFGVAWSALLSEPLESVRASLDLPVARREPRPTPVEVTHVS